MGLVGQIAGGFEVQPSSGVNRVKISKAFLKLTQIAHGLDTWKPRSRELPNASSEGFTVVMLAPFDRRWRA
jgi:hypothetical protein